MKPVTYKCFDLDELIKAFHYAKGLLEVAKFGVLVTISNKKQKRSIEQNSYMWAVVYTMLAEEMGYNDKEDIHQLMSRKFLKVREEEIDGELVTFVKRTSKLKTDEMEDYLEKCRRYGAINLHINIPLPNEVPESWGLDEKS